MEARYQELLRAKNQSPLKKVKTAGDGFKVYYFASAYVAGGPSDGSAPKKVPEPAREVEL